MGNFPSNCPIWETFPSKILKNTSWVNPENIDENYESAIIRKFIIPIILIRITMQLLLQINKI